MLPVIGKALERTCLEEEGNEEFSFWRYKAVDAKLHIQVETSSGQVDM